MGEAMKKEGRRKMVGEELGRRWKEMEEGEVQRWEEVEKGEGLGEGGGVVEIGGKRRWSRRWGG